MNFGRIKTACTFNVKAIYIWKKRTKTKAAHGAEGHVPSEITGDGTRVLKNKCLLGYSYLKK